MRRYRSFRLGGSLSLGAAAATAALMLIVVAPAAGDTSAEQTLAERYAPVVRLKAQAAECARGDPYEPTNVNLVLDNPEIALRGPWSTDNLVKVGPTAMDLSAGLFGYHLDFPGTATRPGCDYEQWAKRLTAGSTPTTYARIATEAAFPGKLSLQYWFFYPYNDFNDKHEGDWEMIQLVFDAGSAAEALEGQPALVGYSQHEGAEQAAWGDPKLEIVDGTHPIVYAASGSHANYFKSTLFLGRSAAQGVGCDDTTGPSRDVRPQVQLVPTDRTAYLAAYPWLGFEGRWGEKQPGFNNGPTGPNTKPQWYEPITWATEQWRDSSFPVPGGTVFQTNSFNFFCSAVTFGSNVFTKLTSDPWFVIGALVLLAGLLLIATMRTEWEPSTPYRLARRRAWGQIVSASFRLYRMHFGLFAGIGLVFIPFAIVAAAIQALIVHLTSVNNLVDSAGASNASTGGFALVLGVPFALLALTIVQAAVAHAMVTLDDGQPIRVLQALRALRGSIRRLFLALVVATATVVLLSLTAIGIPVAIWLIGRWAFFSQAIQLDKLETGRSLRFSSRVVKGQWWRVAVLTLVIALIGIFLGPLVGALMLLGTSASFDVVNLASALVQTLTVPFVAMVTTYLYFDCRARKQLDGLEDAEKVLPAEPVITPAPRLPTLRPEL